MKKYNLCALLMLGVVFQIFIIVNAPIADSYIIHESFGSGMDKFISNGKTQQKIIKQIIVLLAGSLSIKQIGIVSAEGEVSEEWDDSGVTETLEGAEWVASEDTAWNCCPETIEGAICQNVPAGSTGVCKTALIPTSCDKYSSCKSGCCIDEHEGLCTTGAPKRECELDGGVWKDEKNCLVSECQKGCCIIRDEVKFTTEASCELYSIFYGIEKNFMDFSSELDCIILAATQEYGACVFDEGACEFITEKECLESGGSFSKNSLCSNTYLETNCTKQASIGCVDGKDEIYWFDSCGNRENIYSSDRDASWNEGQVLTKEKSCNSDSANINSETCGNCNFFKGSKCSANASGVKVEDGDFVCRDLNCIDEKGVERKNGESWCVYDSYIGDGKDPVGSRHWKRMCIDGEIKVEPCADYRGQICAESYMGAEEENFTIAACIINEALSCINYNSQGGMGECSKNKDCIVKNVYLGKGFRFQVCVSKYPKGFDLIDEYERNEFSTSTCALASHTCTVLYQKSWKGSWKCKQNCNCEKPVFAETLNDICISLGDCGSYINYIGDGTDNIQVSRTPPVSWTKYKSYADPVEGQHAEPRSLNEILKVMGQGGGGASGAYGELTDQEAGEKGVGMLGTVTGGLGILAVKFSGLGEASLATIAKLNVAMETSSASSFSAGTITVADSATGATTSAMGIDITLASYGYALIGAAVGMMVGSYIAKSLGLSGTGAQVMTYAGAVAGFAIAAYILEIGIWGGIYTIIIAIVVAIIVMLWVWIVGWGKTKKKYISFTCMPWQAPLGGANCEKCNDDPLRPCSEYRCTSLGQACRLLNKDTSNPKCESIPNDGRPPIISEGQITDNAEFVNATSDGVRIVNLNPNSEGCIGEYEQVGFTLETDKSAQCKFEFQRTSEYESMTQYPVEQNAFTKNHTFAFAMPSIDSLSVYNVTGDLKELFGNMNLYVRCQDFHGNKNLKEYAVNFCVHSGTDITPARINLASPASGSYLMHGITYTNLSIYMNEPAECRYDTNKSVAYENMSGEFKCNTEIFGTVEYSDEPIEELPDEEILEEDLTAEEEEELKYNAYGWECKTNLTGINGTQRTTYIKCKDKPWVVTEQDVADYGARNVNLQDFVHTLRISESPLSITSILPQGTIEEGFEPISVDLVVETSGGVDDGNAACYYSFIEGEQGSQFYDTFSDRHRQNFNMMMRGDYQVFIQCRDEVGNTAGGNTTFKLEIDSSPPMAIRAYRQGGNVVVLTDEPAECAYSFDTCIFDIDNATSMTTALSKIHLAPWETERTYNVKCKDVWGNTNPWCAIKIKPS